MFASAQGVREAIRLHGQPMVRCCRLAASVRTLRRWQRTRAERVAGAVLLLRRPQRDGSDSFLAHAQRGYSTGTYRLLSGGVRPGQPLLGTRRREAWDALGAP